MSKPSLFARVNYTDEAGNTCLALVTGVNSDGTVSLIVKHGDQRLNLTGVKHSDKPAPQCWSA